MWVKDIVWIFKWQWVQHQIKQRCHIIDLISVTVLSTTKPWYFQPIFRTIKAWIIKVIITLQTRKFPTLEPQRHLNGAFCPSSAFILCRISFVITDLLRMYLMASQTACTYCSASFHVYDENALHEGFLRHCHVFFPKLSSEFRGSFRAIPQMLHCLTSTISSLCHYFLVHIHFHVGHRKHFLGFLFLINLPSTQNPFLSLFVLMVYLCVEFWGKRLI